MSEKWTLLIYPDARLRRVAAEVTEITDDVRKKCLALMELMHLSKGIGLAAPQVAWSARVLSINLSGKREDNLLFINPVVVDRSKAESAAEEACLSVPGIHGRVVRPNSVTVSAMNLDGQTNTFELDGMLARCFLHELDHLDGVLFVDRLSTAKKAAIRPKLRRLEEGYSENQ